MKGDDIAERLLEFAVALLRITTRLPADSPGRHVLCPFPVPSSQFSVRQLSSILG